MSRANRPPAILALEDGSVFHGYGFGAEGETFGEVVFNTALSGYQEVLDRPVVPRPDPGHDRARDGERRRESRGRRGPAPALFAGFAVRALSPVVSSWRARRSLSDALAEQGDLVAIADIDTRAVTRKLRTAGSQRGAISTTARDPQELVERVRQSPTLDGRDLVREVTCAERYTWEQPSWQPADRKAEIPPAELHIVAYDYGIKRNILARLRDFGCRVTVLPAATPGLEALALGADGYFLSNGPGDPAAVTYAAEAARTLVHSGKPVFGICLGHQILGLALGGSTYKLRYGHHGANHPVKDLATGKVEITSQNHGFAVDVDSLAGKATLTHVNLNDHTVEGMCLDDRPVFSVQYHPEASPGPHDASYLFERFVSMIRGEPFMRAETAQRSELEAALDALIERFGAGEHEAEVVHARGEYDERTGKVFDDDGALFEVRTNAFLEWYVVERPLSKAGVPPVVIALREAGPGDGSESDLSVAWRAWATSHRSLFTVEDLDDGRVRLRDIFGGACFAVDERRRFFGVTPRDIVEARLMGFRGHVRFGRTFCFHPGEVHDKIDAHVRHILADGGTRADAVDFIATLRVRMERSRHIAPERIYDVAPRTK